jgi:hypothetical protein
MQGIKYRLSEIVILLLSHRIKVDMGKSRRKKDERKKRKLKHMPFYFLL